MSVSVHACAWHVTCAPPDRAVLTRERASLLRRRATLRPCCAAPTSRQDEDSDEDPRFKEVINAVLSSVSKLPGYPEVRGGGVVALTSFLACPRTT